MAFADTVKFTAGSSGTSDFSDGTALTGFRSLSTGAVSGQTYSYRAFSADLSQWENGQGVYTSGSPGTLARTTQYETSTGSKVSFSSAPVVILTPLKADFDTFLSDQARRNQLLMLANQSKALGSSLRVLETFADGYKGTDGINSGSSANVDTSHTASSGYVGPTVGIGSRITGGTPTAPLGGTAANINDNNSGTSITVTPGNLSSSGTSARIIAKIDYGSPVAISKIEVVGLSYSAGSTSSGGAVWYSTDGITWTQMGSGDFSITGSAATYSQTGNVTARYIGYAPTQTNYASNTITVQDLNGYAQQLNNMTLVTTSQTADATVGNGRVLMEIDPIDSITLGTDLTIELTCNGAANWAPAGTYTNCGKGQGGRTVVETDDVSCTSGTSFAARIKTLNNKNVNVYKTTVTVH
jgi:hypothetical protein